MDHIATGGKPLQVCLAARPMCQQKKLREIKVISEGMIF